ncbi:hypothetical protein F4824DRAFT_500334 [Ustulina deusta]|nr:hypothetical protein F4824DRAFT_500334 [Ustulina deusta]
MEIIDTVATFIAIGQAIAVMPRIISTLKSFASVGKELGSLIGETRTKAA